MTQYEYDTIMKIISSGAPALSNELCQAITNLVLENQRMAKELNDREQNKDQNQEQSEGEN